MCLLMGYGRIEKILRGTLNYIIMWIYSECRTSGRPASSGPDRAYLFCRPAGAPHFGRATKLQHMKPFKQIVMFTFIYGYREQTALTVGLSILVNMFKTQIIEIHSTSLSNAFGKVYTL